MFIVRLKHGGSYWHPQLDWRIEGNEQKEIPDEILKKQPDLFEIVGQGAVFTNVPRKAEKDTESNKNLLEQEVSFLRQLLLQSLSQPTSSPVGSVPVSPSKQEKEDYWNKRREMRYEDVEKKNPLFKVSDDPETQRKADNIFRKIGFKK